MTDIIQRHSKRVNQIIENTLQISRRSEPTIDSILIIPWLEKIISDIEIQKHENPLSKNIFIVSKNNELCARFDSNQMEQVIINLVENALYHGNKQNKDAPVIIAVGTTHDQNQVFIDVIDHGNGITSEGLEHLFEPFYTTELQVTGLGLYFSREIL